jgi:hypothetical protein
MQWRASNMELSLGIAIAMEVILITSLIYCLVQIRGCQKIIKQMQKRSKKYIREVVK